MFPHLPHLSPPSFLRWGKDRIPHLPTCSPPFRGRQVRVGVDCRTAEAKESPHHEVTQ